MPTASSIAQIKKTISSYNRKLDVEEVAKLSNAIRLGIERLVELNYPNSYSTVPLSDREIFKRDPILKAGLAARQTLVMVNQALVLKLVTRYIKQERQYADCFQSAQVGLVRAVELYDARTGFKFSTYACFWIKQSIFKFQRGNNFSYKMPSTLLALKYKARSCTRNYFLEHGRLPSRSQLSEVLNISNKTLTEVLNLPIEVSIDESVSARDSSLSKLDIIESRPSESDRLLDLFEDYELNFNTVNPIAKVLFAPLVEKLKNKEVFTEEDSRILDSYLKQVQK